MAPYVDRTGWAPGPWDNEPDRVDWVVPEGFTCLSLRDPDFGHWCGYVAVPEYHPWHGQHCDNIPSEVHYQVHGGITHTGLLDGEGETWWLGFDCNHHSDQAPGIEKLIRACSALGHRHYRDINYVFNNICALAVHIHAAKYLELPQETL